ncbi:MAG: N-acetyltransferase [Chloroflexota bacterium]
MQHIIKTASIIDISSLLKLERVCFQQDAWSLFDLVAVLTFPDVVRLKAVIENQMVGFIAGDPRPSEKLAWIATLGVIPEFQNKGIGRDLLKNCEKQLNLPRIRLCLRPSNLSAFGLYSQSGYEPIDTWREYYNDKGDALVMEKIII